MVNETRLDKLILEGLAEQNNMISGTHALEVQRKQHMCEQLFKVI